MDLTIKQAKKILKDNGIIWTNYFDLPLVDDYIIACAINRIKTWLTLGY